MLDASGQRSAEAEYDHFYASSAPDVEHTWLICKPCHLGLTTGRGKNDHTNKPNRPIKEILGLPLTRRFRKLLSQL